MPAGSDRQKAETVKWQKDTTFWPAYAGTSEMLEGTLPRAVQRQRSSLTLSTRSWSFCTTEAMERFLSDLKAMTQHQETVPRMRTYLWMGMNPSQGTFEVWEVVDRCPPSTALELELEENGPGGLPGSKCACPDGKG